MPNQISTSREFFLWDYGSTLFPLKTNRLLVEKYSKETLQFVQDEGLTADNKFQTQHRVFASKGGWFLRPTVKLDPVAEFFFYDFVYRNRRIFKKPTRSTRKIHGYQIVHGEPTAILGSYSRFKKSVVKYRAAHKNYVYFDVSSYFNRIYHHDLVRWSADAGADEDDVGLLGKFLRETAGGRSVNCLPQGIYPSKMIGSAFLGFLENSSKIRAKQTVRLMDDMWLFDDKPETLISDFLEVQALLSHRGLSVNEEKSKILQGHDPQSDLPPDIDEIKIGLLRKRREELTERLGYADETEEESEDAESENEDDDHSELHGLTEEEEAYLLSLVKRANVQEEDAELVLTLMRDNSADVIEFLPSLISDFPSLAKRIYHFCSKAEDKSEIAAVILEHLESAPQVTEYQMFWFGMMLEEYLLKTPKAGDLLMKLYEHDDATDISRAKLLEIPDKRFGLADLREEQLRTGHSDWLGWSAAVGSRVHPKGQRNQMLKYFRASSPMNRLIGDFVEKSF